MPRGLWICISKVLRRFQAGSPQGGTEMTISFHQAARKVPLCTRVHEISPDCPHLLHLGWYPSLTDSKRPSRWGAVLARSGSGTHLWSGTCPGRGDVVQAPFPVRRGEPSTCDQELLQDLVQARSRCLKADLEVFCSNMIYFSLFYFLFT